MSGSVAPVESELLVRVNGIQPAFGIEFGLESPRTEEGRNGDPYRQQDRDHVAERVHGPMGTRQFRDELERVAAGRDLRLAEHGMILSDRGKGFAVPAH